MLKMWFLGFFCSRLVRSCGLSAPGINNTFVRFGSDLPGFIRSELRKVAPVQLCGQFQRMKQHSRSAFPVWFFRFRLGSALRFFPLSEEITLLFGAAALLVHPLRLWSAGVRSSSFLPCCLWFALLFHICVIFNLYFLFVLIIIYLYFGQIWGKFFVILPRLALYIPHLNNITVYI